MLGSESPALQSANQRLSEFILEELTDIAAFAMNSERCITSWSPGVERILGYSESDFIGRNLSELFTPEDRNQHKDNVEFESARQNGQASDIRWHLKKDGSRIFVDGVLRAVLDGRGTIVGYHKIMRDISPNRIENTMLRAILDRTPDVIYLKDREGRYVFANTETARLLGRTIEEVIGHTTEEFLPPHISGPLRSNEDSVMERNSAGILEELTLTKEQGERTFLSGKGPWCDNRGNVIGIVSIDQDISDRKLAEGERERLVQELRRSNDDLAEFSHVVSHDLQAPLRIVHSYTELLARRFKEQLDETADEFISIILRSTSDMEHLIKSLLRYAQAGEDGLTRTAVRLDAVLNGVRSLLQPRFLEHSAELTQGSLPTVMGDPVQLLRLFQNLVDNAIKYSRAGVRPKIEISAKKAKSSEYTFAIKDNGLGIEAKNFERIFAPLKRLHGQEIQGSGIGLAVCKKIVERHGGRIWLTSEIDRGSTFYFTLPAVAE